MRITSAVAVELMFQINRSMGEHSDAAGRGIPLPSSMACAATAGLTPNTVLGAACMTGTVVEHAKDGSSSGKHRLSGEV
jgi:hypothetical protein